MFGEHGLIIYDLVLPWNSFLAVLTEVTILATCPSTVAKSISPNSSCAITNTYSPLLRGRGKSPVYRNKLKTQTMFVLTAKLRPNNSKHASTTASSYCVAKARHLQTQS